MLCRRLVLLLVCVCCLVVATHSTGLLLGLAALKGAVLGKKLLLKGGLHKGGGGGHYGYVSHGSYYQPPPTPIYPPYPQYQTSHVHYHTGHIPHYHYVQLHGKGGGGGYDQSFALKGQYHHQGSYSHGGWEQKGHSIYRRSLRGQKEEKVDARENLLLTTVTQLDQEECILKLVCSIQTKSEEERSPNEAVLATIFTDASDSPSSSYTAAFVHAAGVGRQEQDSTPCNNVFSKCAMDEKDLTRALDQAWGCADWNDL